LVNHNKIAFKLISTRFIKNLQKCEFNNLSQNVDFLHSTLVVIVA